MRLLQLSFLIVQIVCICICLGCSHPLCEPMRGVGISRPGTSGGLKRVTLKPGAEGKDALVSSFYPDSNFSEGKSLSIVLWSIARNTAVEESYVDFDVTSFIPGKATIISAKLNLFADVKNYHYGYLGHYNLDNAAIWEVGLITDSWD